MDEDKDQTGQEVTTPDTTSTEDKEPEYQEIHDKDISELLNGDDFDETPKEDETPEEETTPEVKEPDATEDTQPKTDPQPEEKKEEVKVEPPILDTDELSDKAADKIVQRLLDKTDKSKEEKKEILADAPWKKENRQPTWEEALDYVATLSAVKVKEELNQEIQAEEAREKEQQETIATQQEQRAEYLNKTWDDQLLSLEKTGKIPPIVNAESKDDPGMKARLALYQKVKEVKDAKEAQGLPVTETDLSLELAYYRNPDAVKIEQPAGGDAPVAGGGKTVTKPNPNTFTYQELKGDWDDILTE